MPLKRSGVGVKLHKMVKVKLQHYYTTACMSPASVKTA